MTRAAAFVLAAILAGCGAIGGTREGDRYFILEAAAPATPPAASRRDVRALPTTAASFYDTQSMAYSREPGTRAYYQFNHWTERPQRAIHAQLASRFPGDGGARLVLETNLEEIYHDAAVAPGTAHITMSAALVDAASRATIARRTFTRSAPAASYDAAGAVRAFDAALGALLDEVAGWVDAQPGR